MAKRNPAALVCEERDYGRCMDCWVAFGGRRFGAATVVAPKANREMDQYRLKTKVWDRFWRYLGAA